MTYKIAPLEWVETFNDEIESYDTFVLGGSYSVERTKIPDCDWGRWHMVARYDEWDESCYPAYFDTAEAAKEAAWQDWLSRITPALEPVPFDCCVQATKLAKVKARLERIRQEQAGK